MAILAVSLFLPQAAAQTTALQYNDVAATPLQPLTFIQDSYGNVHISSQDTFVWRVLHCRAPASNYDQYLSTGVTIMPFTDYDSSTWYVENLGATDGFTSMTVIDQRLLVGDSMGLFVKFGDKDRSVQSSLRVYYLTTPGETLSDSNIVLSLDLGNSQVFTHGIGYHYADRFDPAKGIVYVDLDEVLLEQRGYLSVHIGHKLVNFVNDPNARFYVYSGLPGTPGFTTFQHKPTTYLSVGEPNVNFFNLERGDYILSGNVDRGFVTKQIHPIALPPSTVDIFRSGVDGTVDDATTIYRPLSFSPFTPYYHEGNTGIGRQTFTIPYYELYDDPQSDSTNYQITCTITNPWGSEDLFPHRFTYRVPTAQPPTITTQWFTGNFTHEHNVTVAGGLKLDKQYGPPVVLPVPHVVPAPVVPRVLPIGPVTNQTLNITLAMLPNVTRIDPPPIGGFWTANDYLDLVLKIPDYDGSGGATSPIRSSCTVTSKTALTPVYPVRDIEMINSQANTPGSTYGVYHQIYARVNMSHPVYDHSDDTKYGHCIDDLPTIARGCARIPGLVIPPSPEESFTYSCEYDGQVHTGTVLAKAPMYRSLIQDLTHTDIFGWGSPQFLGIGIIGFLGLMSCMVGYNRKNLAASAVTFVVAIGMMGYFGILNVTEAMMAALITVTILAVFQRGVKH